MPVLLGHYVLDSLPNSEGTPFFQKRKKVSVTLFLIFKSFKTLTMNFFFSSTLWMCICILSIAHTTLAQSWMEQNSGISQVIPTVKAVDENIVWAGAENGIYLRTTDGGTNWTSGSVPGVGLLVIVSIAAIDSNTAYYAATSFGGGDARIYKTTDGGANWVLQYQNTGTNAFFNSIAFWNETNGIAVSDAVDGSFLIVTTTNGGADWNEVPAANIPPPLPGEFAGFGDGGGTPLAVEGNNNAWFGTAYNIFSSDPIRVFKSTDQGQHWTVAETPLSISGQSHGISTMAFKDPLNGFAGGGGISGPVNHLVKTTDGGETWTVVTPFFPAFPLTLVYVPNTAGTVLVVTLNSAESGFSKDGGLTWESINFSAPLLGLSFASPTAGWAVGLSGLIVKFVGDFVTAVAEQDSDKSLSFGLSRSYPNPFKSSTTIRFSLPSSQFVTLKVYDKSGHEIRTLLSARKTAGSHELRFDGSQLSPGIYLFQLQVGQSVESQKMVLIK